MVNRLIYGAVALLVLFGLYFLIFCDSSYIDKPSSGTNIIALGDSLIVGVGALPGRDLVSVLSRETGLEIINAGISGDATKDGLVRLEKDVLGKDPKIIILCLGGNDILRNVPAEEAMENLREIIRQAHARGAGVLLLGVKGGLGSFDNSYKSGFEDLAEEMNVSFLPDILGGVMGDPKLMSDQIHPNSRGYELIAKEIAPILKKMAN